VSPTPLQRALSAAPDRATVGLIRPEQEFFCFRLGELRLGVPSENVREVARIGPLTPLPRMVSFVMGVAGHRGEVLPVVDLLRLLGKGEVVVGPRTRLFIANSGPYNAAMVADSVLGLVKFPVAEILPVPMGGESGSEHVLGVVNPGNKESAVTLLRFSKLLQVARQRAVAK
jgi:purine-binding chemotaxis protein CheW